MSIFTTRPSSPSTCRLLFIISTHNKYYYYHYYYYTLYSLSVSLAKSLQLIFEISATYRLVSYLLPDN